MSSPTVPPNRFISASNCDGFESPNWHPLSKLLIFVVVVASKIEMILALSLVYGVSASGDVISDKFVTVECSICDAINANLSVSVVTFANVNQNSTLRNHASMSSVLNGGNGTRAAIVKSSLSDVSDDECAGGVLLGFHAPVEVVAGVEFLAVAAAAVVVFD